MRPSMEISTNVGCRNNCTYCPQKLIIKKYSDRSNNFQLSFENFKKYLNKIPKDIVIIFSGVSEPFFNKRCVDMILYAHEQGYKVDLYTTLVGITLEELKKIEDIPFTQFIIHLPNNNGSEKIDINEDYIEILEYILEKDMDIEFRFFNGELHDKLSFVKAHFFGLCDRAGNLNKFGEFKMPKLEKKITRIRCGNGIKCNGMLPNGDVILCCNDFGMKHVLGNLSNQSYSSLFRSKEFKKIKEGKKNSDIICNKCNLKVDYRKPFPKAYHAMMGYIGNKARSIIK